MILLLWCLHFFLEISAEETLYRMKSQCICLDPGGQPPYSSAKWMHGDKIIFSNGKMNPTFEKKMHLHESNATLCIKNWTENDNVIYTFAYEKNFTNINKGYRLIVEDAVPKPAMSVTVVNVSVGVCLFTVNCSVQHHILLSECDEHGCRPAHRSFTELNITVSIDNETLTCTGNNHVSSKAASRKIEELCFSFEVEESHSLLKYLFWILAAATFVPVVFVFFCWGTKTFTLTRCKKQQPRVIQSQPLEQHSQPRISTSSAQADASYENVDPQNPDENPDQEEQNVNVHTIYCMLEPLPGSAAKNCEETTPETSEERSDQVHTVYSVIKRPNV